MSAQLSRTHPRGSDERRGADPSECGAMPLPSLRGVGSLRAGSSVNEGVPRSRIGEGGVKTPGKNRNRCIGLMGLARRL